MMCEHHRAEQHRAEQFDFGYTNQFRVHRSIQFGSLFQMILVVGVTVSDSQLFLVVVLLLLLLLLLLLQYCYYCVCCLLLFVLCVCPKCSIDARESFFISSIVECIDCLRKDDLESAARA